MRRRTAVRNQLWRWDQLLALGQRIGGPAIVEGLLLGGIGAALALVGISILYSSALSWLGSDLAGLAGIGQLHFLGAFEVAIMLVGGVGVGALAGTVASRVVREPAQI